MTDLQRIPTVYRAAWHELHRLGSTARSSGGNPNRPGSKPPAGMDRRLRASIVQCARALSDATWHLGHHSLPTKPWRPVSFVHNGKLTVDLGRPWREMVSRVACQGCDAAWNGEDTKHGDSCRGQPIEVVTLWIADRWSPSPDDLAILIPHPDQIQGVCSRLSGNLGLLETRLDPGDPHVKACERAVKRARGALHDVWPARRQGPECGNCGAPGVRQKDPPRCGACTKYLERNKRDRPASLWHAA